MWDILVWILFLVVLGIPVLFMFLTEANGLEAKVLKRYLLAVVGLAVALLSAAVFFQWNLSSPWILAPSLSAVLCLIALCAIFVRFVSRSVKKRLLPNVPSLFRKRNVKKLLQVATNESYQDHLRCEAVAALGKIGDPQAMDTLIQSFCEPVPPRVTGIYLSALDAVAEAHDTRAVFLIQQCLSAHHEKYRIYERCVKALAQIRTVDCVQPTIDMLQNLNDVLIDKSGSQNDRARKKDINDLPRRGEFVRFLGDLRDERAISVLKETRTIDLDREAGEFELWIIEALAKIARSENSINSMEERVTWLLNRFASERLDQYRLTDEIAKIGEPAIPVIRAWLPKKLHVQGGRAAIFAIEKIRSDAAFALANEAMTSSNSAVKQYAAEYIASYRRSNR